MTGRHEELKLDSIRTLSIHSRKSKVNIEDFAAPLRKGMTATEVLEAMPNLLASRDLKKLISRIERAVRAGREWIILSGGHLVKTGLAPVVIPAIRDGWVSCFAMNGSAAIHDVEIALFGKTSEAVEENLGDGSFGMAEETADFVNGAARRAEKAGEGFGETLGQALLEAKAPHGDKSLLTSAALFGMPVTVHVAIGTDIVHQHPSASGGAIGEASLRDFRVLAARVAKLSEGVVLNVGSAVLMPEVFLKALTVARNLGGGIDDFTAVNFDMIRHYRPLENVVSRPTAKGGWGTHITGHHEILLPLLIACLLDRLEGFRSPRLR
jgi:hypothetical protein